MAPDYFEEDGKNVSITYTRTTTLGNTNNFLEYNANLDEGGAFLESAMKRGVSRSTADKETKGETSAVDNEDEDEDDSGSSDGTVTKDSGDDNDEVESYIERWNRLSESDENYLLDLVFTDPEMNELKRIQNSGGNVQKRAIELVIEHLDRARGNNVQGENISSRGSSFAKLLTNAGNSLEVEYKGTVFRNAEHAYQTWKSGTFDDDAYNSKAFKPVGSKRVNKTTNFQTMVEILTAKLKQHPDLIAGINERGGLTYLEASTHNVIGDSYWESSGQNKFIEALVEAAKKVGITYAKEKRSRDKKFRNKLEEIATKLCI